jgi:hypothetical protein
MCHVVSCFFFTNTRLVYHCIKIDRNLVQFRLWLDSRWIQVDTSAEYTHIQDDIDDWLYPEPSVNTQSHEERGEREGSCSCSSTSGIYPSMHPCYAAKALWWRIVESLHMQMSSRAEVCWPHWDGALGPPPLALPPWRPKEGPQLGCGFVCDRMLRPRQLWGVRTRIVSPRRRRGGLSTTGVGMAFMTLAFTTLVM